MKEIKYRVWNTISKIMKPFSEIKRCGVFAIADGLNSDDFIVLPLKNSILNEYTGRKDKNDVEIYVGDIVIEKSYPFFGNAPEIIDSNQKCDELNYVGVIIWEDGYCVDLKVVSNRVRGSAMGLSLYDYEELEVVGNIYENPELLENGK